MPASIPNIAYLECLVCHAQYAPEEINYTCPHHGVEGILDVIYDYDEIKSRFRQESLQQNKHYSIWRYAPLLPIAPPGPGSVSADRVQRPLLKVGWTPCYQVNSLAKQYGLKEVWIKDDGMQPTGSLKDRASAIAIVKAQERFYSQKHKEGLHQNNLVITTASTGNAAAALSGLCAGLGIRNVIFVPESAPAAKVAQLLVYGSEVRLVRGTYDNAFDLCLDATENNGWYCRNTGYNPYMSEGKKTASFEIFEQLGERAPDVVFVSVGDGCIIGGIHKGFKDLLAMGWIDRIPRLIGVQAEGSNYLAEAWANDEEVLHKPAIKATTVADSISAGLPRDRLKAMRAVRETEGAFITVSDEEILKAVTEMARASGVFGEPAGAAAYAGFLNLAAAGKLHGEETVVIVNTGNGLKDVPSAQRALELIEAKATVVDPL